MMGRRKRESVKQILLLCVVVLIPLTLLIYFRFPVFIHESSHLDQKKTDPLQLAPVQNSNLPTLSGPSPSIKIPPSKKSQNNQAIRPELALKSPSPSPPDSLQHPLAVVQQQKEAEPQEEPLIDISPSPDDLLLWDDYQGKYSAPNGKVVCRRVEYQGLGTKQNTYTRRDLNTVLNFFHEAQRLLVDWIGREHRLSENSVKKMKEQIHRLKVVFPPPIDQPDLKWRGVGIWNQSEKEGPSVQIGNGYVRLAYRYPKRALFEMTRLVAQSWMPCELKRRGVISPWDPLLECLKITEHEDCDRGGYSTTGWAISSVLATVVSPPGCTLPIFLDDHKAQCLQKIRVLKESLMENGGRK